MKRPHNLKLKLFAFGIASLFFGGCTSLVETAGRALDGSAFTEKKTAVYRTAKEEGTAIEIMEVQNKAGERSLAITLQQFPSIKIRGTMPNDQGGFFLTSLDYLGGDYHGWNEYRLDLSGMGNISFRENTVVLSLSPEIETVQISSARIRRYDNRITGTEALTNLRNRRERILALAEWMNNQENILFLPQSSLKEFETYWKPALFPETVSKKKQPQGWQQEGDRWNKAEDIRWNVNYSQRVFPEILWNIRNSGTLLRDWEEAIDWIYLECEWGRIMELLSKNNFVLYKK
ncbi:MAG: hypothetical protein LBH44_01720 [Treponema sp.]|jgi:hypothetical protein|nr:hypothetical protein [Treponema sp.]